MPVYRSLALVALCLLLAACGRPLAAHSTATEFPPCDQTLRIGVLPFVARTDTAAAAVADEVSLALMRVPNVVLIERTRMVELLTAKGEDPYGRLWSGPRQAGEITGVDAFLLGDVHSFESRPGDFGRTAIVSFNARVVDARSGKVLFLLAGDGSDRSLTPGVLTQRLARKAVGDLLGLDEK